MDRNRKRRRLLLLAAIGQALIALALNAACSNAATVPLGFRDFQTAYQQEPCGTVVTFTGALSDQEIDAPAKCGATNPIVFQGSGVASASTAGTEVAAGSGIEFRDFTGGTVYLRGAAQHITLRRVNHDNFYIRGSDHVKFLELTVKGNGTTFNCNASLCGDMNWISAQGTTGTDSATDVLFDGVTIHNFLKYQAGEHIDCIGVDDVDGFTFRNGNIFDCAHFSIIFGNDYNGRAAKNVLLENSRFQCCHSSGGGHYSVAFGGLDGPVTVKGSTIPAQPLGWLNDTSLVPNGLVTVDGNTIASNNTANCPRATWRNNLVTSGKCAGDGNGPGASQPSPTPTPTPTPTPSPEPTSTPTPEPTPTSTPEPTPTPEPAYEPACKPDCDQVIADLRTLLQTWKDWLAAAPR